MVEFLINRASTHSTVLHATDKEQTAWRLQIDMGN